MLDQLVRQRFWEKVDRSGGPNACWPWTAGCDKDRYGNFTLDGHTVGAHRISWEIENGLIPCGLNVLHHCDNPPCVNPRHLWLGTQADNQHDMVIKGRHAGQRVTQCPVEHPYDDGNTYTDPSGKRHCRRCVAGRDLRMTG